MWLWSRLHRLSIRASELQAFSPTPACSHTSLLVCFLAYTVRVVAKKEKTDWYAEWPCSHSYFPMFKRIIVEGDSEIANSHRSERHGILLHIHISSHLDVHRHPPQVGNTCASSPQADHRTSILAFRARREANGFALSGSYLIRYFFSDRSRQERD